MNSTLDKYVKFKDFFKLESLKSTISFRFYFKMSSLLFPSNGPLAYNPIRDTLTNIALMTIAVILLVRKFGDPELENLDPFTAGYLLFITYTTIGFGDITFSIERFNPMDINFYIFVGIRSVGYSSFSALLLSVSEIFEYLKQRKYTRRVTPLSIN